jgi:hypothetical protein
MGGKERTMTASIRILALSATTLAGLALATNAWAQEIGDTTSIVIVPQLNRADVAGGRLEPEFAPQPVRAGPLVVDASLSLAAGYDTNVFDRPDGRGDAVALITPRVRVRADTARHLLQLSAMGHVRRFASTGSEDSEEFDLQAQTRIDLAERQSVFASASWGRQIEARSSVGTVINADEPVSLSRASAQLGADVELGRLWLRPVVDIDQTDYSNIEVDGVDTDLSFRNTRNYGGDLTVGYKFSDLFAAFGQAGYGQTESLDAASDARRDADDISLLAGVRGELSPLVYADLAVGYRKREYELERFRDYQGFNYRANVQYFLTPLVTLQFQASQSVLNSGNPQVAGILSNRASVSGYYDPLRNLRLSTTIAYEHNQYRETDTVAQRPSMRVAAQFQANRNISLGFFAGLRRQEVSGTPLVQEYTSFSSGLGITLTP